MRMLLLSGLVLLAACSSSPPPRDYYPSQMNSYQPVQHRDYAERSVSCQSYRYSNGAMNTICN